MKTYSSSSLKPFVKNCPKAADFYEAGEPRDRSDLDRGVCTHAILEYAAGQRFDRVEQIVRLADRVAGELIAHGRTFRGELQAPLIPESAFEGRDLAVQYLSYNDAPPAGMAEVELWMDKNGKQEGDPRYVALVDLVYETEVGEEEDALPAVVLRDYKTAWPTGAGEVETLQMRGQAALAALHFPDHAVIIREAVNVRTGGVFRAEIVMDDEGQETLAQWRRDILATCDAADANAGNRMSRPGYGCMSCWYSHVCQDALCASMGEYPAMAYATAKARVKELAKIVQADAKAADGKGLEIPGGIVGYRDKDQRTVTPEAIDAILEYGPDVWNADTVKGLLMNLKLGVTQVDAFAKAAFPKGDHRLDDFKAQSLSTRTVAKFDVYPGEDQ